MYHHVNATGHVCVSAVTDGQSNDGGWICTECDHVSPGLDIEALPESSLVHPHHRPISPRHRLFLSVRLLKQGFARAIFAVNELPPTCQRGRKEA